MEVMQNSKCVKLYLPNGKTVDVLTPVLDEITKWTQVDKSTPEGGGYIVGYQHINTGNITLEAVSHPYLFDIKNRIRFDIKDFRHKLFLGRANRRKSYYMGVWHTHPQEIPFPSDIDWNDWNGTMRTDITGCQFVFFAIAGTKEWRIWAGDLKTGEIQELFECTRSSEGIYLREGLVDEGLY